MPIFYLYGVVAVSVHDLGGIRYISRNVYIEEALDENFSSIDMMLIK